LISILAAAGAATVLFIVTSQVRTALSSLRSDYGRAFPSCPEKDVLKRCKLITGHRVGIRVFYLR
jgi:hypothetical protein